MTVDPSSSAAGIAIAHYNVTVCIAASPADCFDVQCVPTGGPGSSCTVQLSALSCVAPATNCLRASTAYEARATAIDPSGIAGAASDPPTTFTTTASYG